MTTTAAMSTTRAPGASPKNLGFTRGAFAIAQGRLTPGGAEVVLTKMGCDIARHVVYRADATVATTGTAGNAAELAASSFGHFLADLSQFSGAARLISLAKKVTLGPNAAINYPVRTAGAIPAAAFVGEGGAIPLRANTFGTVTVGPSKKLAAPPS